MTAARGKLPVLDGLRGVAAFLVVAAHMQTRFNFHMFFRAYLCVDLFFIMSGMVISRAYGEKLATGQLRYRDFLITRIIRLHPMPLTLSPETPA
jgi:peptidoglycan/LPS O-acetylase OafA/YrhL